jgi:anaerobic dimethyl sulfoxide reductase subunit A
MKDENEFRIIHTTGRNNCGGRCVIHAHVRGGKIEKLTTDTPQACGGGVPLCACVRGMNYHRTFLGEDRLKWPMKRVGERGEGKFERISWEEAVDTIVKEWIRIRDTYGPGSRYVNYATGVSALLRGNQMAKRLLSLDGGFLDSYNSYSTACITQATKLMYGTTETGNSLSDWLNANLIILWGHNPAETKFDCGTMYYLHQAKQKGIPIIVIDPRKNDTVLQLGAEWIPLRPATDSALADAMAYVIVERGLQDQDFLDRCCIGFDREHMPEDIDPSESYLSYLMGEKDGIRKTPQWGEAITGVKAEDIERLAVRYASARPAALIQGYGAQRHAYGEQSARGAMLLACLTGNVGISGGWASGTADCTVHKNPSIRVPKNAYGRSIPVFLWTEAILRGHEMTELDGVTGDAKTDGADKSCSFHLDSDIKMILNLAGNTLINQHGDINRTAEILRDTSKCEFIVCSDLFMTASARFADILLPGVSMFECENITMPWKYGDFLGFTNQVIEPLYEGRFEYDWLVEVARGLGLEPEFSLGRTAGDWLKAAYDALRETEQELPEYEQFKEAGIYRYQNQPIRIAFEKERQDPEHFPFPTPSGKIEIFSEKVYRTEYKEFFPAIPRYVQPPEGADDPLTRRYPLQMIGWHTKRRCHSIHDNNQAMHRIDPQCIWMHPEDAAARGIHDGEEVCVYNDRGRVQLPAHITDRILRGVVGMTQGAWYRPDADGTDHGGSINVLTSQHPTPYARGNAQHTNLVEIKKLPGIPESNAASGHSSF